MRYSPSKIESKWQKKWLREKIYEPDFHPHTNRGRGGHSHLKAIRGIGVGVKRAKKPFYNLMMFPYPSAEGLHIGSVRTFTGIDIYGRFKRMQGNDVFEPIGLDGFGIHSENYALKIGKHPVEVSKVTEKNFYRQLGMIGNGFAWQERLETYDPGYYKWTQWIFTQMFKRGLAYRKKQAVNWCPSCKTVLADEQVIAGKCERCSSEAIKKELEQWFFKITDYAERLLKNLEKIDPVGSRTSNMSADPQSDRTSNGIDWSERVKIAQKNWIGKSEGALITFNLIVPGQPDGKHSMEVFTTRPDTLFGVTFMVISPETAQKWLSVGWKASEKVKKYVQESLAKKDEERIVEGREKTGVETGVYAINPANQEKIPVWAADYVLGGVGTGAIMAVPAHDERDFEFAKKFNLPIRHVIEPLFIQSTEPGKVIDGLPFDQRDSIIAIVKHWSKEIYIGLKWKSIAWGTFITGGIESGQTAQQAAEAEIREETGFLHPKLIADFGIVHGKFYHGPKKVNRFAHSRVFYFKLQDGTKEEISSEEQAKHDIFWFTKEELKKFLTPDSHQWAFEMLNGNSVYIGEGMLTNSGEFSGMDSENAKWDITKSVNGKRKIKYRLRDWLISRQRYWSPPIPMILCDVCKQAGRGEQKDMLGWYAVPEKDLPVKLPHVKEFRPTGTDKSPLATIEKFYKVRCPKCKSWAKRETDVSDTFLDSAWYFLRYPSTRSARSGQIPWDPVITKKWLPVNMYIGGAEHSVLHLLYSRFLTMVFHDWKLINFEEPFTKFRAHGLITKDGAKMSKSKGNVVNPDEYIAAYGSDAMRMYLAFIAPLDQGGDFRDTGIRGITRFLERVWKLVTTKNDERRKHAPYRSEASGAGTKALVISPSSFDRIVHKTIRKVTEDIENLQYNTAISALMILLNEFEANKGAVGREDIKVFLKLLAPFAPHIAEELYQGGFRVKVLGFRSIHHEPWPKFNPKLIQEETFELVVQVNGKVRGRMTLPVGISEAEAKKAALNLAQIKQYVSGDPRKIIFIPNKLINFVV